MPYRKVVSRLGFAAVAVLSLVVMLALAAPALAFPDVPPGHQYEEAINDLSALGIIGGYKNGDFGLNDSVKRAQFAKMIVGTLGITPNASTVTRFTDLGDPDANGYPHVFVQTAYDNGITYGTNNAQTLFAPWNPIRRDQVVSMIVRGANEVYPGALESPPGSFSSLFNGVGEPHGSNLRIADYNGLLDGLIGMGPGWNVTATATRGEVAQMLWNLLAVLDETGPPPIDDEIWVYSDGSGDYPTIEAAVASVAAGSTIFMGPGVFQLSQTLGISRDVTLVGSGMDATGGTTVRCAADVVGVGAVEFTATDIRFICTGGGNTDVVYSEGGMLALTRCYLGGGSYSTKFGNGLSLEDGAAATLEECQLMGNDSDGIGVFGDSYVNAVKCVLSQNGENGIGIFDTGVAVINQSDCMNNALHGVSGNDDADVTVQNSRCSQNGSYGEYNSGIYLEESAVATIYNCECSSNLIAGISINDEAEASIDHVTCDDNGEDGIVVSEDASAMITNSLCSNSHEYNGIFVCGNGYASIEDSRCTGNYDSGIYFADTAGGYIDGNECDLNDYGLYIEADSYPTVSSNNYFHDNTVNYYFE